MHPADDLRHDVFQHSVRAACFAEENRQQDRMTGSVMSVSHGNERVFSAEKHGFQCRRHVFVDPVVNVSGK